VGKNFTSQCWLLIPKDKGSLIPSNFTPCSAMKLGVLSESI
jgi:hypothetical protein